MECWRSARVSSHADTRASPQVTNVKMMLEEEVKEPRSFSPEAAKRAMAGGAKPTKSFVKREIHAKVHVSLSPPRLGGAVCGGRTGLDWRAICAPEARPAMRAGSPDTQESREHSLRFEEVSTVGWHKPTEPKVTKQRKILSLKSRSNGIECDPLPVCVRFFQRKIDLGPGYGMVRHQELHA